MQAIPGGKAKNAKRDAPPIAVLLRGGMLPQADGYPAPMRATRDLLRPLLSATATSERSVVSSWLLSGLGLDTLRQQGQGSWSAARLQACLPRLRRFLCSRSRRRGHQEGAVRAWLAQRASPRFGSQQQVA
jgi:hypothetical protein